MKNAFSGSWIRSTQPRKQRKYVFNAPLHIKASFMKSPLSKDLRTKSGRRTFNVKAGDKVRVVRGQFKGKSGRVDRIDLKRGKLFVTGVEMTKKDGGKVQYPLHPSNVMIEDLALDDKKRKNKFEGKKE